LFHSDIAICHIPWPEGESAALLVALKRSHFRRYRSLLYLHFVSARRWPGASGKLQAYSVITQKTCSTRESSFTHTTILLEYIVWCRLIYDFTIHFVC